MYISRGGFVSSPVVHRSGGLCRLALQAALLRKPLLTGKPEHSIENRSARSQDSRGVAW